MAGTTGGTASHPDLMSTIEASGSYKLSAGDVLKRSTGPHDFFKEIQEAMDTLGTTENHLLPPSTFLERLQLDKIPMIQHDDQKLINNEMFITNSKGVAYKFHAGTINGLPLYSSLIYKKQAFDPRPKVNFHTQLGTVPIRDVRRQAVLIHHLQIASRTNECCTVAVAKAALVGNGAIAGRNFVLSRDEIKNLIRLCAQLPALNSHPATMVAPPVKEQAPVENPDRDATHSSRKFIEMIPGDHEEKMTLKVEEPDHSRATHTYFSSPEAMKGSGSSEHSESITSSTSKDTEMGLYISDPSEYLSIDAAMREGERSGHSEVQAADAKIEKLTRQKEKLERSLAKAIEKKRVGKDKIQKAERWKKDSKARLTPSLRAFWEAASRDGRLPDAS